MCVNKFPAILIYGFYKSTIIYLYLVPEDWSYMSERINQHLNPLVGNNIRRLRKERGLKATEVIAKLQLENVNVTTGIFSKVENGYNNPTVDMLVALTKIFECDFNEFFRTILLYDYICGLFSLFCTVTLCLRTLIYALLS